MRTQLNSAVAAAGTLAIRVQRVQRVGSDKKASQKRKLKQKSALEQLELVHRFAICTWVLWQPSEKSCCLRVLMGASVIFKCTVYYSIKLSKGYEQYE